MKRLKALPVRLIEIDGGVILKRGSTEVKISGEDASQIVETVLASTATDEGAAREEILEGFAPSSKPAIEELIDKLIERRLLMQCDSNKKSGTPSEEETALDIFYWNLGETVPHVSTQLNAHRFIILGVNHISQRLTTALAESGVTNVRVVDHPLLRNVHLFKKEVHITPHHWPSMIKTPDQWTETLMDEPYDCLVVTSDFGSTQLFQDLNHACVKRNRHFLPIILQDQIGYIGPLVVPGETACFECLRSRQRSHTSASTSELSSEEYAFECQDVVGFHPSMASILGDFAAIELTRFYSSAWPNKQSGSLIEINLLDRQMLARKVLKIPRCTVCSSLNTRPSIAIRETAFVSNNRPIQ